MKTIRVSALAALLVFIALPLTTAHAQAYYDDGYGCGSYVACAPVYDDEDLYGPYGYDGEYGYGYAEPFAYDDGSCDGYYDDPCGDMFAYGGVIAPVVYADYGGDWYMPFAQPVMYTQPAAIPYQPYTQSAAAAYPSYAYAPQMAPARPAANTSARPQQNMRTAQTMPQTQYGPPSGQSQRGQNTGRGMNGTTIMPGGYPADVWLGPTNDLLNAINQPYNGYGTTRAYPWGDYTRCYWGADYGYSSCTFDPHQWLYDPWTDQWY